MVPGRAWWSQGLVVSGLSSPRAQWSQGSVVPGLGGPRAWWSQGSVVPGFSALRLSSPRSRWSQGSVVPGLGGPTSRWSQGSVVQLPPAHRPTGSPQSAVPRTTQPAVPEVESDSCFRPSRRNKRGILIRLITMCSRPLEVRAL